MNNNFSLRFVLIAVTLALCVVLGWRLFLPEARVAPRAENPPAKSQSVSANVAPAAPIARASVAQLRHGQTTANADEDAPSVSIVSDRPHFIADRSPAQRKAAEADVDLRNAVSSVRNYRKAFNQNPVGNNAEITQKLLGKNSQGVRYLPTDIHINDKGQLTDRWDQPVFFHQISKTMMEIRSAGPDHVMWTGDDEVLR